MTSGQGLIISRSQLGSSNGQTVRVYYADANNPGVEIGYFVPLELELNYTSIGTCAGGRMSALNIGGFQPYFYVLGVEVFHNGAWDRIFLCTHTGAVFNGEYYTVDLVSLWEVVRDGFVPEDTTYGDYPLIGYIVLDSIQSIGSIQPTTPPSLEVKIGYGMTWAAYYRQKYFDKGDDHQWGYDANGTFLAGYPGFFTAANYNADRRLIEQNDQGYPDLDYVTEYKGFNADLPTLNEFEGERTSSVNTLVPRRAQVVSWDASKADDTYLYRYTQVDPAPEDWTLVESFPRNETIENGQYFEIIYGSDEERRYIFVKVQLKVNEILSYYDDITNLDILIKFNGVNEYTGQTFSTSVVGFIGSNPQKPDFLPTWFKNSDLTFRDDFQLKSSTYDEITGEGMFSYIILTTPFNVREMIYGAAGYELPYTVTLNPFFGIKQNWNLKKIKDLWYSSAYQNSLFTGGLNPFNQDLTLTWAVCMGFDEYSNLGEDIKSEVELSFIGRRISDGWVEPPGFNSEIHGDTAYRMIIDGIFIPPVNITTPQGVLPVAGSTVRFSPAVGAQSEILTGILPNRRRDN